MKARKTISTVLAVLPLFLIAVAIILEIIAGVGARIDPVYWFEHPFYFISSVLFVLCLICTLPCIIATRVLNRPLNSGFIDIVTWIDIIAIVIPLIRIFVSLAS